MNTMLTTDHHSVRSVNCSTLAQFGAARRPSASSRRSISMISMHAVLLTDSNQHPFLCPSSLPTQTHGKRKARSRKFDMCEIIQYQTPLHMSNIKVPVENVALLSLTTQRLLVRLLLIDAQYQLSHRIIIIARRLRHHSSHNHPLAINSLLWLITASFPLLHGRS